MKLVVVIPCHDEEGTLPATVRDLPRTLPGIDTLEVLVVDDGSTDGTMAVARASGAHHVVSHWPRRGLAAAFEAGLDAALAREADVIVTTDGDNQYCGADVARLIEPILAGRADIVVGDRGVASIPHWSPTKRRLQRLGTRVVRSAAGIDVADATSGFRAFTRSAALRLKVFGHFSPTLETLIQAGRSGLGVVSVPVRTNPPTRPSRLFRNPAVFVARQTATILRVFLIYQPFVFFGLAGAVVFGAGFLLGLRFLAFFLVGQGQGHVQSLILAAVLLIIGFQLVGLGLLGHLSAVNRRLLEEIRFLLRQGPGKP